MLCSARRVCCSFCRAAANQLYIDGVHPAGTLSVYFVGIGVYAGKDGLSYIMGTNVNKAIENFQSAFGRISGWRQF